MMDVNAHRLVAEKLTKRYFGAVALVDVSLTLRPGEIHGLLGENGAGKSTLLKIISGVHRPDSGQVFWEGQPVDIWSPRMAGALGIAMIHQELNLVQDLSVAENVFIRREPTTRLGLIDWKELRRITQELLVSAGIELDPWARVRDLSIAEQQMVEIARALSANARLLIMDEPTSSLPEREVQPSVGLDENAQRQRHIDPLRHPPHGGSACRVRSFHGLARWASRRRSRQGGYFGRAPDFDDGGTRGQRAI